jgi:hypothetical protein
MRAYDNTAKRRKKIGFDEERSVQLVAFNWGRGNAPTFNDWFDDNEKLDLHRIFDCKSQTFKFDLAQYGNTSPYRNAASILASDFENHYETLIRENVRYGEDDNRPVETDDPSGYLGSYRRMKSPGLIRLNLDNMQVFFWDIVCRLACRDGYEFTRDQITELARLCIYKTVYHELFHHFMDVQSHIVMHHYFDRYREEALAVACSRILVGFESRYNHLYVSDFLAEAYKYTAPGYRDWEEFRSSEQFVLGVRDYMPLENHKRGHDALARKGQHISPIITSLLYGVIENPNVRFEFIYNR